MGNKSKNKQMGLNQTKKIFAMKETTNKIKKKKTKKLEFPSWLSG